MARTVDLVHAGTSCSRVGGEAARAFIAANLARMTPQSSSEQTVFAIMPHLLSIASNIVDRGDTSSYPDLNDWSDRVMKRPEPSRAMFWGLLVGATMCRDQAQFDEWHRRGSGMFFDEILGLFLLANSWVLAGATETDPNGTQIDRRIDLASSTSEPWTTLSQLTVAVVEVVNRFDFQIWMQSEDVREAWLGRFKTPRQ